MGDRRASLRTRFQAIFVGLALAAIGLTIWIASVGASAALREATWDRLAASRHTRQHALERYIDDLASHVVALSTSETTLLALRELREAWPQIAETGDETTTHRELVDFYEHTFASRVATRLPTSELLGQWLPNDPRVRTLQHQVIAASPHPVGAKDLLLETDGAWGAAHARHHPTFHRYQTAFGFYDIFLISVPEGRVLYTVMKEVDLGADLTREPYRSTRLGRVFERARALGGGASAGATARGRGTDASAGVATDVAADIAADIAIEDFAPYIASAFAPAAFIAAPVRVAGETVGVLAMQISIREVDRVMTGAQRWVDEGLGDSGQAYVVGADNTLRSDLRPFIENPDGFFEHLRTAGVASSVMERVRHDQTAVLNLPVNLTTIERVGDESRGTELGLNLLGDRVLRSRAPLQLPGLDWTIVAEIDEAEAFAPVRALQWQLAAVGLGLSALFFVVSGWLGASVSRPMLELAATVRRLGAGDRSAQVPVRSKDEVGELASAFNRLSADLDRTMVSKTELEKLAGRLISAQEDERRRVARELHDDLVQRIAAAAIEVGRLERLSEPRDGLENLKRTLARLSEDVHRLSRRIHPAMLDELGLAAALEAECRAFMERGGPPVDLQVPPLDALPSDVSLAIYRIVQEALRNAWQHAGATDVGVTLERSEDDIRLNVRDNGAGFERRAPGWVAGLGLASMEERARLLGGEMRIDSTPGGGTRIDVRLPLGTMKTMKTTPDERDRAAEHRDA